MTKELTTDIDILKMPIGVLIKPIYKDLTPQITRVTTTTKNKQQLIKE